MQALSEARAERDALKALDGLVGDLQAHAKEQGWQDVDEPIAAPVGLDKRLSH
jgi:hypothetical protein